MDKYNRYIPNSIKIGYIDYQFDFWPETFASTEEAQGEFFPTAQKIGLKESTIPVGQVSILYYTRYYMASSTNTG